MAESLVRARQWTPAELAVLAIAALAVTWWLVDVAADAVVAARDRWRQRAVSRVSREGVLRYADPGRVARETARQVGRLADRPAPLATSPATVAPDAGAARRADGRCVAVDEEALSDHVLGGPGESRADAGDRRRAVSRASAGLVRESGSDYGISTHLVLVPRPARSAAVAHGVTDPLPR